MTGRTRRVRHKQASDEATGTQISINADEAIDLVATGAVSALVTMAVQRSFNRDA